MKTFEDLLVGDSIYLLEGKTHTDIPFEVRDPEMPHYYKMHKLTIVEKVKILKETRDYSKPWEEPHPFEVDVNKISFTYEFENGKRDTITIDNTYGTAKYQYGNWYANEESAIEDMKSTYFKDILYMENKLNAYKYILEFYQNKLNELNNE